ncbi:hypothetical protein PTKIN_Ptkin14bG0214800 [Pterospermum kingtungense]
MDPSFDDSSSLYNFVVRDGNGVKGMVDLSLSKVPEAYMQPTKERIDKVKARKHEQPPIDLSRLGGPDHDQVAEEIVRAAETLGFFQVVNHGVPVDLLESLKDTAHNFFSLPTEKKAVYRRGASPTPLVKYGTSFVPEKERALEWKDYINMQYTNDAEAFQHWPVEIRNVALEFLNASIGMVRKLLEVLLGKFGVKPEDPKIDAFIGKKMREEWIEISPTPNALVVNVRDMLQILSNGRYKSAEHRARTTSTKSRVSIPIFTIPKPTEKIAPLPQLAEKDGIAHYREIVLADYMNNFFGNAHDGKKTLDFAKTNSA